jgi:disulfide bond formation protein DsbB
MPSRRVVNFLGFLACAGLIAYAILWLQLVDELEPCPLCIFQRVAFAVLGVVFLAAAIFPAGHIGARVYAVLVALSAAVGAAIAGRHVWLQNLPPDQVPECGPGLGYMFEAFPLAETLKMVLTGSGECAELSWSFLGLSIPAWALVWFVLLGVAGALRNALPERA